MRRLVLTIRQTGHDTCQEPLSHLGKELGIVELSVLPSTRLGLFLRDSEYVLASLGVFERDVDMT